MHVRSDPDRLVARGVVATVVLAAALWLALGTPLAGYDTWWALVWGRELAHGALPDLTAGAYAPTPHPLAIVVAAPVSLLGAGAPTALALLALLGLAACGTTAATLGARLFGPVAGALAAAILVTRPLLVADTLESGVDVAFLALVLGAGAALVHPDGARRTRALTLLTIAGLLRPEAWPLALAAALFAPPRAAAPPRGSVAVLAPSARALALALAAPLAWLAFDWACTGDPLHSLHGTRVLADGLDRPRTLTDALRLGPDYLTVVLGDGVALLGGAAAIAALWVAPRRAALPLVTLGAGVAAFLVLGLAGLPLLYRYTLLPAAALALLAAWTPTAFGRRAPLVALVTSAILLATAPSALRAIHDHATGTRAARAEQRALTALVQAAPVSAALQRCAAPPLLSQQRPVPQLAYLTGRAPTAIRVGGTAPARGVTLIPDPASLAATDRLAPTDAPAPPATALRGAHRLDANRVWTALSSC